MFKEIPRDEVENTENFSEDLLWIPEDRMKKSQEPQYVWDRSSTDFIRFNSRSKTYIW